MKIVITQAIVAEGKYDKMKLANLTQCPEIITTGGFSLRNNTAKQNLIRRYAASCGIIILTDSDPAGVQIRNYVSQLCDGGEHAKVFHAYLPTLYGKERRKTAPSKTGIIGVEGTDDDIIIAALSKFDISANIANSPLANDISQLEITKQTLYEHGITGTPDAAARRQELLSHLRLPLSLSTNALVRAVNTFCRAEFETFITERNN